MSGFSIDPLLLPSCTEAAWFQSPDLDEDAHLTFWEKLHEQQAMPALAPFACACFKPNEIPIAAWLLSISLYSLYSLSTLSLYSLSLLSLSLSHTHTPSLSLSRQLRHQESVDVPRARHTISLFANISSIRWDYNSKLVKGFITSTDGAGMKAFEVDPEQYSRFDITNHLWTLMDVA